MKHKLVRLDRLVSLFLGQVALCGSKSKLMAPLTIIQEEEVPAAASDLYFIDYKTKSKINPSKIT